MNHITVSGQASKPSFPLGQVLATPGAISALQESEQKPLEFLSRHLKCDWGDVCEEDKALNDQAIVEGSRILSAYHTAKGEKLWIITEAADDQGQREATTILLPDEY